MEGSCAGSSLTLALVVHTWPTPSCLHPSLLSPMTMLTTRSCLLHAHLWWASTSPFQAPMQVLCKLEWSTLSQQMSVKGHCLWGHHMGWPVREGEAWSDLMFFQRYRGSTASLMCPIDVKLFLLLKSVPPNTYYLVSMLLPLFFPPQQQLGVCQPPRGRRPPTRSVAVQKEVCTFGPDGRTKTVMLVDAAQQTGKKSAAIFEDAQCYNARCVYIINNRKNSKDEKPVSISSNTTMNIQLHLWPTSVTFVSPVTERKLNPKKHSWLCYYKLFCLRTRIFPVSEEAGHNASKSNVLSYRFMLMMFALDFGKNWNADFPVGKVNTHAAHGVTKDVSILKKC